MLGGIGDQFHDGVLQCGLVLLSHVEAQQPLFQLVPRGTDAVRGGGQDEFEVVGRCRALGGQQGDVVGVPGDPGQQLDGLTAHPVDLQGRGAVRERPVQRGVRDGLGEFGGALLGVSPGRSTIPSL